MERNLETDGLGETPSVPLVEKLNELSPMARLGLFAKALGIKLNDPNPDCPTCNGKGYLEVKENGEVVPCMCIYPGFGGVKMNREGRRKLARKFGKRKKAK